MESVKKRDKISRAKIIFVTVCLKFLTFIPSRSVYNTVGSPFLSEYSSIPYRTATYRLLFWKIVQNQRKMPFFIRVSGVFYDNLSDSANRNVT
jgi:hypothetical protein